MPTVVLMDSARSVGGTWAAERLYPGLKTNNVVGSYEFSDFPLDLDRYALKPGQHIPGPVVHRYLIDCAHHFELSHLIRLQTMVDAAALHHGRDWLVDYCATSGAHQQRAQLVASRLVLATGVTSVHNTPSFPGQHTFRGTIFHAWHLGEHTAHLASARSVVVLGGNKSAWDAWYTACQVGAQVHMVMRPSGGGPSWCGDPFGSGRWWTPHYLGCR
jgi:cation diffusion facilitator CzcD-associated flavoprotein CzcO